jgi:hypothetical protein
MFGAGSGARAGAGDWAGGRAGDRAGVRVGAKACGATVTGAAGARVRVTTVVPVLAGAAA